MDQDAVHPLGVLGGMLRKRDADAATRPALQLQPEGAQSASQMVWLKPTLVTLGVAVFALLLSAVGVTVVLARHGRAELRRGKQKRQAVAHGRAVAEAPAPAEAS